MQTQLDLSGKTCVERAAADELTITEDDLAEWLTAGVIDALESEDVGWLADHATQRYTRALSYPVKIYRASGDSGLLDEPRVITGTIHSVKGGQADIVYLFPDLSRQAALALEADQSQMRDAVTRMAYVGMTRAREELYLCRPSWKYYWSWRG